MPRKPDISNKDVEILKAFVKANSETLKMMHSSATSDEYIRLRKKLVLKYQIENGEVKFQ